MKQEKNELKAHPERAKQVEGSFTQLQGVEEPSVGVFVMALEVFEEAAASADHFEQSLAGVKILLMGLEMRGQLVDALSQ